MATSRGIQRFALRERVRREVLRRLQSGLLAPDLPLREVELAQQLSVSRTPLREALVALESEGHLVSDPGRGFRVPAFEVEDVRQCFQLLGSLEALALLHSAPLSEKRLTELRRLNSRLEAMGPEELLQGDDSFHDRLIADCSNPRLLRLIAREREHLARFRHAGPVFRPSATDIVPEHETIAAALQMGDPKAAAALLERHWKADLERWISRRRQEAGDRRQEDSE